MYNLLVPSGPISFKMSKLYKTVQTVHTVQNCTKLYTLYNLWVPSGPISFNMYTLYNLYNLLLVWKTMV